MEVRDDHGDGDHRAVGRGVSVCLSDPELPIDLMVASTVRDPFRIYLGRITLNSALRDDLVRLIGTTPMVKGFHRWMQWSTFAPASNAA